MLKDIIYGLEFLHSRGILHRSLSSASVCVVRDRSRPKLMIGDFISLKQLSTSSATSIIDNGAYIAPEVMDNTNGYSFSADVWSFGMLVFTILTLREPYFGLSPHVATMHILQGKRPVLSTAIPFNPSIQTHINHVMDIFTKCTTREPESRPNLSQLKNAVLFKTAL